MVSTNQMVVALVLGFAALMISYPIIGAPIIKLINGIAGNTQIPEQETTLIPEQEFSEVITSTFRYCGIGQESAYCKCDIPVESYGDEKKIYLKGQGMERTHFAWITGERPAIMGDGAVKGQKKMSTELLHFGPLCLHFNNEGIVDDPLSAFMPPGPGGIEKLGILFFKNKEGNLEWTSNALPGGYVEYPTEPAVFWRKIDATKCLWLPRVKNNIGRPDEIMNQVPYCEDLHIDFRQAEEEFMKFVEAIKECGQLQSGQQQSQQSKKISYCRQWILTLPPELDILITPDIITLRYIPTAEEINQQLLGKNMLCVIRDIEDAEHSITELHPIKEFTEEELTAGVWYLSVREGRVCIGKQPLPVQGEQGESYYLNSESTAAGKKERQYLPLVMREANQQGIDYKLVQAIIQTESAWDPNAKSQQNSLGIMQLNPDTAKDLNEEGKDCPLDYAENVESNIKCGIAYIKVVKKYVAAHDLRDPEEVIAGYNGGTCGTAEGKENGALCESESCHDQLFYQCEKNSGYAETRAYVPRVMGYYQTLNQEAIA